MFQLADENYYSREADIHYMSCSQFQAFQECEAAAIAKLRGLWEHSGKSDALLHGQYFHSYFEGQEAFDKFCEEHFSEIYKVKSTKSRGDEIVGKYAAFEKLDEMIEVVEADPVMAGFLEMPGENEKFLTGEIGGIPWRMKMDKYMPSTRIIVDYKTSADIRKLFWNPETKEYQSFVEEYGYLMRAAVYGEIERQNAGEDTFPTFVILAVSKQDPPDKDAVLLNDPNGDARWELELETVKAALPRIQALKDGTQNPKRCGQCEYCRSTKKLNRIKLYTDLLPAYRNDPDNVEYDDYGGSAVLDTL